MTASPLRFVAAVLLLVFVATSFLYLQPHKAQIPKFQTLLLNENHKKELAKLKLTEKEPIHITDSASGYSRTIHGRFLHVTDFHPDPFYKAGSSIDEQCHSGSGDASSYGDSVLGCDSPMSLVYDTIDWIDRHLKDKIDFIVWTGDNIRHDNDRRFPRTEADIFEMNEHISSLMWEKFGFLPVPLLGNNDVYPHNLFAPGPTLQTREFFKVWRNFIPQLQLHIFNRGAYFFQEVIPDQLAVLSINTLYLFKSNPLVDLCDDRKDPGYKLFLWLGYVLKEMRRRNMKVWFTGHVPPNTKNYDFSCLRKYILWAHEYRDVVIGGLFGHMNIDHFIPLDSEIAYKSLDASGVSDFSNASEAGDDFSIFGGVPKNKVRFMDTVRETLYTTIDSKKKSGKYSERYSVAHVSASVVPTFNPGLRVWEYNITGLKEKSENYEPWELFLTRIEPLLLEFESDYDMNKNPLDPSAEESLLQEIVNSEDPFSVFRKKDKTFPPKMPKSLKLGPAHVPQTFTPERYVQYYVDLFGVNSGKKSFDYEVEYTTEEYGMKDLTVDEWLKVGRKLGKGGKKSNKLWKSFLRHAFIDSDYENRGYG